MNLSQKSAKKSSADLDVAGIKKDFPILATKMNGKPLVYLDSAATSQKPIQVISAITKYYREYNANIHRGVYKISEMATEAYTDSKRKLANFIGANSIEEIVYVRNTTEAINLVALSWGDANVQKGDHILISEMEHHSNIVPWQILAKKKGAVLDYIKLDKDKAGLSEKSIAEQLEKRPAIVAITHVSNVLGSINDVKDLTKKAKKVGALVLVDGAQSAPHMPVNVKDIGCDFFALSGHKMLAPTGIGALYGKKDVLNSMPPLFGGGDMIKSVEFYSYTPNDLPWKFEAGTSNIEGGIGLGAAIDYLNSVGMSKIREHEKKLTLYGLEKLSKIKNVELFGYQKKGIEKRGGVISFSIKGIHPHDVAAVFDSYGIAIRAGHHCAMPLVKGIFKEGALSRISFYLYNEEKDVDAAVEAIYAVKKIFKVR
jgi:cysteine desulfurase/selenocysteine lyase